MSKSKIQFNHFIKSKKDKKLYILGKLKAEPRTTNERSELLKIYNSL